MAITAVDVGVTLQDTSNVASYTTVGSWTPVANRLYLLAVVHSDAAPEATVPTVSAGNGLNWVQVGSSTVFDTIVSNLHRLTLFRAMKASGLSLGGYTVNFSDASTGCAAFVIEFDGIDTTGTDGANAIRQPTSNNANATANPTVALAAFASGNNGTFACVGHDAGTAVAATGTLIPATPLTYNTPATRLAGLWDPSNISNPTFTLASCDWAMIALELVAAPVVAAALLHRRGSFGQDARLRR